MKFKNALLLCFLSISAFSLSAEVTNHIQPVSNTSKVDTSLHGTTLALDVVRVSADVGNCSNVIEWVTPAENNCYSFVIMKSSDKINYTALGSVLGNGTTNQPSEYQYLDNHPNYKNYYRIDQYDFKGRKISSEILMMTASCGKDRAETIIQEVYPNPLMENQLEIRVLQNVANEEKVQLTDQFGKAIIEKNVKLKQGKNLLRLNVSNIIPGTYFIKVGAASQKFTK